MIHLMKLVFTLIPVCFIAACSLTQNPKVIYFEDIESFDLGYSDGFLYGYRRTCHITHTLEGYVYPKNFDQEQFDLGYESGLVEGTKQCKTDIKNKSESLIASMQFQCTSGITYSEEVCRELGFPELTQEE